MAITSRTARWVEPIATTAGAADDVPDGSVTGHAPTQGPRTLWPFISLIPFGLGAWAPILAGVRARRVRWAALGALWCAIVIGGLIASASPDADSTGVPGLLIICGWTAAVVTSFWIRGAYKRRMGVIRAELAAENLPVIGPRSFGARIGSAWPSAPVAKAEKASAGFLHDGEQLLVFTPARRPSWSERGRLDADFLALTDRRLLLFIHIGDRLQLADEFPRDSVRLLNYKPTRCFVANEGDGRPTSEGSFELATPDGRLRVFVVSRPYGARQKQIARAFTHGDTTVRIPTEAPKNVGGFIAAAMWLGFIGVVILRAFGVIS
jgi:hypothetical protein